MNFSHKLILGNSDQCFSTSCTPLDPPLKWYSTLIVEKSSPGHDSLWMFSLLSAQRFHLLNQDFFPMKCRPTEDVRMYFWLETKMQGKQPPGNSLQSYLFLVTKLSFGKTVVRFSLSHFESDLCMMNFTVFD